MQNHIHLLFLGSSQYNPDTPGTSEDKYKNPKDTKVIQYNMN